MLVAVTVAGLASLAPTPARGGGDRRHPGQYRAVADRDPDLYRSGAMPTWRRRSRR
ncbi:MAG: hypothetical protein HPM95_09635 [Alphaproteobacteria bacterium]|nr:hypothetical protein [Alphaproteobacteria bacterium]